MNKQEAVEIAVGVGVLFAVAATSVGLAAWWVFG